MSRALDIRLDVQERFQDVVGAARRAVEITVELSAMEIWGQVKEEAPVDQGRLAGSFVTQKQSPLQWRVFTNVHYALAVMEGREPHTPSFDQIARWAGRKGLEPGRVFSSIKVHGTRANRYAERALESAKRRVPEFADIAVRQVKKEFDL